MQVSIKLLPHYTFLENILVGGKARNSTAQSMKGNLAISGLKRVTGNIKM